ncbi:hypothetical protein J3E69DRAFT_182250 [Trichoderma sp. SZMC 28015]
MQWRLSHASCPQRHSYTIHTNQVLSAPSKHRFRCEKNKKEHGEKKGPPSPPNGSKTGLFSPSVTLPANVLCSVFLGTWSSESGLSQGPRLARHNQTQAKKRRHLSTCVAPLVQTQMYPRPRGTLRAPRDACAAWVPPSAGTSFRVSVPVQPSWSQLPSIDWVWFGFHDGGLGSSSSSFTTSSIFSGSSHEKKREESPAQRRLLHFS